MLPWDCEIFNMLEAIPHQSSSHPLHHQDALVLALVPMPACMPEIWAHPPILQPEYSIFSTTSAFTAACPLPWLIPGHGHFQDSGCGHHTKWDNADSEKPVPLWSKSKEVHHLEAGKVGIGRTGQWCLSYTGWRTLWELLDTLMHI